MSALRCGHGFGFELVNAHRVCCKDVRDLVHDSGMILPHEVEANDRFRFGAVGVAG